MKWTEYWSWVGARMAQDGGVATFTSGLYMNQNVAGLQLRGLDATTRSLQIYGQPITFVGDAFITGEKGAAPQIRGVFKGTGDNDLTKRGAADYTFIQPVTDVHALVLADGTLTVTNAAGGTFLTECTAAFRGGEARWTPVLAAGASASATLATGAGSKVVYGNGESELIVSRGAGASATLTLGPLEREAAGVLVLQARGGLAALGETERIRCTAAPETASGLVTPTIVARDTSRADYPFAFLSYDTEKGFVKAPYVNGLGGGADKIAYIDTDTVVSENTHVLALVVDKRARLTINEGVTLTVGDGLHPAAVVFNAADDAVADYDVFAGAGTLAFDGPEALIYHSNPQTGRGLNIQTRITCAGDVNFVSGRGPRVSFFCLYPGFAQWQGATHVSAARLWLQGNDGPLPAGSQLVVHGGASDYSAHLHAAYVTVDNDIRLAGSGAKVSDGTGAVYHNTGSLTLNGAVTLDADAEITVHKQSVVPTLTLNGPLQGPGDLSLNLYGEGTLVFNAANAYGSTTSRGTAAGTLVLGTEGTFGGGSVNLGATTLKIDGATAQDVTNVLASTGRTVFNPARLTLQSGEAKESFAYPPASLAFTGPSATLGTVETTTATTLGVGPSVSVTALTGDTGETVVRGTAAESVFALGGAGADQSLAARLVDGDGRLSFVKQGSNTVTLHGAKTYTGRTKVAAGTLKLEPDILRSADCAYWLDAAQEATLTRGADGQVTKWASANGNGVDFVPGNGGGAPSYSADGLNGKPTVVFTATDVAKDYDNLVHTASEVQQRTVFIVTKTTGLIGSFPEIFGSGRGRDYGLRNNGGTAKSWRTSISPYTFATPENNVGVNGRLGTSTFALDTPYVLTMIHADDAVKGTGAIFCPGLGGYNGNGRYNGGISEVIAFKRVLTEVERKGVENYLAKKWGVNASGFHAGVEQAPRLSPSTDLELLAPATFDLNGADLTVASLSGEGTITSSGGPATLTVSGACDFKGIVSGDVTLVRAESGSTALDLRDGANAVFAGGTTTLAAYTPGPKTEGLLYWLDASRPETVLQNADGVVTGWVSRTSNPASGLFRKATGAPTYDTAATGFGGKPAVHLDTADALVADNATKSWTVFFVACADGTQGGVNGVFGRWSADYGFRHTGTTTLNIGTGSGWTRVGDYLKVNGTRHTSLTTSNITLPNQKPYVLSCRLGGWQKNPVANSENRDCRNTLGKYTGNPSAKFWMAEVLAYERDLSNEEIDEVEAYLMAKWLGAGSAVRPDNASVCNGTGGLVLEQGATVDAAGLPLTLSGLVSGGGTLKGDVTLKGDLVVRVDAVGAVESVAIDGPLTLAPGARILVDDYTKASRPEIHTVLSVTGAVTGTFSGTNVSQAPWKLFARDGVWRLSAANGTVILFK